MQAIKNMNKVKNKPIPCKYTINKKIPKIIKISFNIDIQATIKLQKSEQLPVISLIISEEFFLKYKL